jgi:phospholipid/cholesterol/gamma-HCH transport system substrate-binding protein
MASNVAETAIGALVIAAAAGFMVYAAQTADVSMGGVYELSAKFRKAEGVGVGGDVRVSGVKVGSIRSVALDPETYQARVVMAIRQDVKLPEDSAATIASEGLLGGAHIAIQPGGAEFMLEAGDEFGYTQGSVSLLDLIGKAISATTGSTTSAE